MKTITAILAAALAAGLGAARPAVADCIQSGTTVTCTGNSPAGFTAGAGVDGLDFRALTGAVVGTGVVLNNGNTITNNGTVSVGDGGSAIRTLDSNTVTNAGLITVGQDGRGVHIEGNGNAVTNSGQITAGPDGIGVHAEGSGNTVTNSGMIQVGDVGTAIIVDGASTAINTGTLRGGVFGWGLQGEDGATLVNRGTIVMGDDGTGMVGFNSNVTNMGSVTVGNRLNQDTGGLVGSGDNLSVINTASGAVTVGNDAFGMGLFGNAGTLQNNGAVTVGNGAFGMALFGNAGTLQNNGTMTGGIGVLGMGLFGNAGMLLNNGTVTIGNNSAGMFAVGTGNTYTNNGTISVGSASFGIADFQGTNSRITNTGRLVATGPGSVGVLLGDGSTLTNSGTITIPTPGFALYQDGNQATTVVNSGTIDGEVALVGTVGSTFTNAGQLTVSGSWTGVAIQHRIDGVFTQTSAGSLGLRVAATGGADSLAVLNSQPGSGVANLAGTLRALVQSGLYANTTTYTNVLTFAGSTGRFSSVTTSSPFFSAAVIYNLAGIDLVLSRIPFNQVQGLGSGSNAQAVGTALEAGYSPNLTGAAAAAYGKLFASTAPNTFQQLAGEIGAAGTNASFAAFGSYFATVFGQMSGSQGSAAPGTSIGPTGGNRVALLFGGVAADSCAAEPCDAAAIGRRVTAWAQGFGSGGSVDGNASTGSSRVDMSAGGGAVGLDVQFAPGFVAGVTLGTTSAGYNVSGLSSYGSARAIVFGLYGEATAGPAYLDAALGFGFGSYNTTRVVSTGTGGISELLTAAFDGKQYGGRVEAGWRVGIAERTVLTPFAGLLVQAFQQNGYTETSRDLSTGNAGAFGLAVQGQTTTSVRSSLGAQVSGAFTLNDGSVFSPRLRVAWAHEFNPTRSMNAALATLAPASTFTVQGAGAAVDAAIVSAGFDLDLTPRVRLFAQFDGDFASNARSFAGTGGVKLTW